MADFVNSATLLNAGFGNSATRYKSIDNAIVNTASTSDTSIAPSPGVRTGRIRIRTKSVDASATTQVKVTLGDGGSNTVTIVPTTPATAAGEGIDYLRDFIVDFAASVVTVVFTIGGATKSLTYDLELVANP